VEGLDGFQLEGNSSMKQISRICFPKATQVTDRFHVQKLALEALQEIRIGTISSRTALKS
jgi:transposase